MFRSLFRLKTFVGRYSGRLISGMVAFGVARFFEATVPISLAIGIDRIAAGNSDLLLPVAAILGAVTGRFLIVTVARYLVRSAGMHVAFDLRQALYGALQYQG